MQHVIGEFHSYAQARRAVHRLEHHGSIQDVVITGRDRRYLPRSHIDSVPGEPGEFLVLMSADDDTISEARVLLAQTDEPASRDSWHALTREAAALRAKSDPHTGLSRAEASRRAASFGPNALPARPARSVVRVLLHQFQSPLIYLLLGAAAVALAFGKARDASVIVCVLCLNALLGAFQELRAERSLRALGRLTAHSVNVLRGGQSHTVNATELVPGDILVLQTGDAIGADARIMESAALHTGEAALTGEATAVSKSTGAVHEAAAVSERQSMVYAGTHVTAGRGRALVVDTGVTTQLGRIAHLTLAGRSPTTPLEARIQRLGHQIMGAALGMFALIVGLGLLRAMAPLEIAMIALSQVVGMVPEGLPVAVTIALSIGVQRMSRRGAIVRDIAAVETLGSTTVVCTDKTGTLTRNELTVVAVLLPNGRQVEVTGAGYAPQGEFHERGATLAAHNDPALRELLEAAALCSDAEVVAPHGDERAWRMLGDPTEAALVTLAMKARIDPVALRARWRRVAEVPFDASSRLMAVQTDSSQGRQIVIKGAPAEVLALCGLARGLSGTEPLDDEARRRLLQLGDTLQQGALRLLAVALVQGERLDPEASLDALRGRATFLGLLGALDPARPEASAAVASCRSAGIRTVMITGDHANTALALARSVGIFADGDRSLDGPALQRLTGAELAACVGEITVFSRVHPSQKLRIVEALQRRGEVVAMIGDGVNDAPALARADVGVAMGLSGTEVAREAAKVVLTDDNFATLRAAIEEGRVIYRNLRKVLLLLMSTAVAEVIVLVAALALGYPAPFSAVQILWINLVSEGLTTVNLVTERAEGNEMLARPIPKSAPLLDRVMIRRSLVMISTIVAVTLGWFTARLAQGVELAQVQTETFTLVVFCAWFNAFNCRFETRSTLASSPTGNLSLIIGVAVGACAHALVLFYRPLGELFGTVPLPARSALGIIAASSCVLWTEELRKYIARSRA